MVIFQKTMFDYWRVAYLQPSNGQEGAIRSVWGIHIPFFLFPTKNGEPAMELRIEFPNHLRVPKLRGFSSPEAFFPGPAADLFSRLPAAIETLQGRLGSDESLGSEAGMVT